MLYATSSHALQFSLMLFSGILLAGVSLVFSSLRGVICAKFWLCLICDILMGIIWAAVFCTAVTLASGGQLRLFHVLSAVCGALLFTSAVFIPIRKTLSLIGKLSRKAVTRLSNNPFIRALCK